MNAPQPIAETTAKRIPAPVGVLAELTYRCPLACPYCSNPLEVELRNGELDTAGWQRVFSQAAELGVLHAHLSGGEPAARRDLVEIVAHCSKVGLYTNLITSGVGLTQERMRQLADAGLDHVQLSIQDAEAASADKIGGYKGGFAKKIEVAKWVNEVGLPLTINAVIHRANIERAGRMVAFAVELGARRVEIAHTQYYAWALVNQKALMPTRAQTEKAVAEVEALRDVYAGKIVIDHVIPDYYAKYPKACMGGWAKRTLNITPQGKALPCHAAETIPSLEFWNVKEHSLADIWWKSPAFNAFRGTEWMREPCRSCERKEIDYGGCRCQAMAMTGDAHNADPICHLSPDHAKVEAIVAGFEGKEGDIPDYVYRRYKTAATVE
ncbi:MAG: pyrroloquinoline quinone biosynthesis protein PqqE [Methylovirgula sp.]|jgi:pyrroloquinoline quinone biosynthesis protein E